MWSTASDVFAEIGDSEPLQCRQDGWRVAVDKSGFPYYDLGVVGKRMLAEMKTRSIPVELAAGQPRLKRGLFLHRIRLRGEVLLLCTANFGGTGDTCTAKFLMHPLNSEHRAFFERVVRDFNVVKVWFVDTELCNWFAADEFFGEHRARIRRIDNMQLPTIFEVPLIGRDGKEVDGARLGATRSAAFDDDALIGRDAKEVDGARLGATRSAAFDDDAIRVASVVLIVAVLALVVIFLPVVCWYALHEPQPVGPRRRGAGWRAWRTRRPTPRPGRST